MRATARLRATAAALAAVFALATVGVAAAPAAASVQAAKLLAASNKVVVKQGASGAITITPNTALAAKLVEFEFSSIFSYTDAQGVAYGGDPEIFQLRNNKKLTDLDTYLAMAGQGGATGIAGMQWILANTTFYGGLPLLPSNKFGAILPAGTYYVAQMQIVPDLNLKPSTTAKKFTILGPSHAIQPYADQKIEVVNPNGPDIFSAFSVPYGQNKLHNGDITVVNKTGGITSPRELHFFALWQVVPGTTDQQACNWFNTGTGNPFLGGRGGFGTMTSQRAVHGHLNVPLGTYFLWSGVPDGNTGVPSVKECEGLIVQVVA